jgi:Domain of unknown function (DUF4167)
MTTIRIADGAAFSFVPCPAGALAPGPEPDEEERPVSTNKRQRKRHSPPCNEIGNLALTPGPQGYHRSGSAVMPMRGNPVGEPRTPNRVAVENLYQHADHYFRVMNAADEGLQHRTTRPTAPAYLETERWRRRTGPRWLVRRAPHQKIGSLTRSDLPFGANSLHEDLPLAPLVSEARTADPTTRQ